MAITSVQKNYRNIIVIGQIISSGQIEIKFLIQIKIFLCIDFLGYGKVSLYIELRSLTTHVKVSILLVSAKKIIFLWSSVPLPWVPDNPFMHLHLMNRMKYLHRAHKYRSTDRRTHPMLATSNSNKSPQRNGRKKALQLALTT